MGRLVINYLKFIPLENLGWALAIASIGLEFFLVGASKVGKWFNNLVKKLPTRLQFEKMSTKLKFPNYLLT